MPIRSGSVTFYSTDRVCEHQPSELESCGRVLWTTDRTHTRLGQRDVNKRGPPGRKAGRQARLGGRQRLRRLPGNSQSKLSKVMLPPRPFNSASAHCTLLLYFQNSEHFLKKENAECARVVAPPRQLVRLSNLHLRACETLQWRKIKSDTR